MRMSWVSGNEAVSGGVRGLGSIVYSECGLTSSEFPVLFLSDRKSNNFSMYPIEAKRCRYWVSGLGQKKRETWGCVVNGAEDNEWEANDRYCGRRLCVAIVPRNSDQAREQSQKKLKRLKRLKEWIIFSLLGLTEDGDCRVWSCKIVRGLWGCLSKNPEPPLSYKWLSSNYDYANWLFAYFHALLSYDHGLSGCCCCCVFFCILRKSFQRAWLTDWWCFSFTSAVAVFRRLRRHQIMIIL